MRRAQSHIAQLALTLSVSASVAENPALCPARPDPQVQAAAVRQQPRLLRPRDCNSLEPRQRPCHERPLNRTILLSHTIAAILAERERNHLKDGHVNLADS